MAKRASKIAAKADSNILYFSAIGSHRLKPRPLKNILYPYYRNYKPVYRARNPRTPLYYWPEIDKYPWHSHQKRFPKTEEIGIELFSEFCNRDAKLKTLYETLHPLPNHGVNCVVWKRNFAEDSDARFNISIAGNVYNVSSNARKNSYYHIKQTAYKLRPFKGKIVADLYLGDKLIRENVSPIGSVRGIWDFSFPYKSTSLDSVNPQLYRVPFEFS